MADTSEALAPSVGAATRLLGDSSPESAGALKHLFRDMLWQVAGAASSFVVTLLLNILAVRLLGRWGFGAFGLVQTVAIWGSTLLAFGAPTGLLIYSGTVRHKDKRHLVGLALTYLMVTILGTSIWVCLDPPGPGSLTMSKLSSGIGLVVILLTTLQAFFLFSINILRGADRFELVNLLNVVHSVSLAVGVISGALLTGHYVGALWGAAISLLLTAVAITAQGIRSWGVGLPPLKLIAGIQGSVGLRSYLVRVSEVLSETFGILFLAFHGDLYGLAAVVGCQRMSTIISKPAAMVNGVLMGKIAGQKSGQREARKTLQVARLTFCGGVLLAIPLLLFARPFVLITLGPEFRDAVSVMVLYILSATLRGHATATSGLLMGQGCRWPLVILKVAVLALTIVGVLTLVPTMGAVGVALVQTVTSLVLAVFTSGILMIQARSVKAALVGNDLAVLRRLAPRKRSP